MSDVDKSDAESLIRRLELTWKRQVDQAQASERQLIAARRMRVLLDQVEIPGLRAPDGPHKSPQARS